MDPWRIHGDFRLVILGHRCYCGALDLQGWAIVKIDGVSFSYDEFKMRAEGNQDFVITFEAPSGFS